MQLEYVHGTPATTLMQFLTSEESNIKSKELSAEQVQH